MRKTGKRIGSRIYIHRQYEHNVPKDILNRAKETAGDLIKDYTCVRYDGKDQSVAFQFSPDFDTEDEPTVGKTVLVRADGGITITPRRSNPLIWHHKWMWVADNYQGFDVEASKARSDLWKPHIKKGEKQKIGNRKYWDLVRKRWE